MALPSLLLHDFRSLPATHSGEQRDILEWLAAAHAQAELTLQNPATAEEREAVVRRARKLVLRFGCATDRIRTRNACLGDFTHTDWSRMRIFTLDRDPQGKGCEERSRFYGEVVDEAFQRFYAGEEPPDALIHVTCTGYVAPSGAQRLVAARNWGATTEVVHAYHMGCYASLPGLRLARGLVATGAARVDLVHTELCTLHLNPLQHGPEQLVVQTLFSDGLIRYTASSDGAGRRPGPALAVLGLKEEIIPGTEGEMGWMVSTFGMEMTLSRHVPEHIRANLAPFLDRLAARAGLSMPMLKAEAHFAIHPGGPRIIDEVAGHLGLKPWQVQASNAVLLEYGNMSSATLPHIWKALLEDPAVAPGALIVALAFGPGLTVSGAILRKS